MGGLIAAKRGRCGAANAAAATLAVLLLALACGRAAAQPRAMPGRQPRKCGAVGGECCPECMPDIPLSACDQWSCADGAQCYAFANKQGLPPDGGFGFPMVCLKTPKTCGKEGGPCCYNADPASEDRCGPGLTCVVENERGALRYATYEMYQSLTSSGPQGAAAAAAALNSTAVMGACVRLTKNDCGKRWRPCGAAAKKLGCGGAELQCKDPDTFCASPGDTRMGGARCLPAPAKCGQLGRACCPANLGGRVRARALGDGAPAPFCGDGSNTSAVMCVWLDDDYRKHGVAKFPESPGTPPFPWDGVFERGHGRSRCIAAPKACGQPGQPCCPSMLDQRLSGMVHSRVFEHQPCDYRAGGRAGVYCNGTWQGGLLLGDAPAKLGTCTINSADCGQPGKPCCFNDVPEIGGSVGTCQRGTPKGGPAHYCASATRTCLKCPERPATQEQADCFIGGGGARAGAGGD